MRAVAVLAWGAVLGAHDVGANEALPRLAERCARTDEALTVAAARLLTELRQHRALRDGADLEALLREVGSADVWPAAMVLEGRSRAALEARFDTQRSREPAAGLELCGAASEVREGRVHAAVIRVDALARLATPLPQRARVGAWLPFEARVAETIGDVHVKVAGRRGAPHEVPSQREGDRVVARFAVAEPGPFVVQLVGDDGHGPRPLLQVVVFAATGEEPSFELRAPGEDTVAATASDALGAMIDETRRAHRLPSLRRDPALDAAAEAQTRAMMKRGRVAHDAAGAANARLGESVAAKEMGENVARASALFLAHRSLYASPSHRENLLGQRWARLGVSVLQDDAGSVWVTELFASSE